MKKKNKMIDLAVTSLALLSLLLSGCGVFNQFTGNAQPVSQVVPTVTDSGVVIAEGHMKPRDDTNLFFKVAGNVSEVLAKEGDQVTKGMVLARLGDREKFDAAVTSAKLEQTTAQQQMDDLKKNASSSNYQALIDLINAQQAVDAAQQKYDQVDTDNYQIDLYNAQSDVATDKDDLKNKQDDFDKYKDLDKNNQDRKNAETALRAARKTYDDAVRKFDDMQNNMDQAKDALALAQAQLTYAKDKYSARKDGMDADTLALAQSRLDNANAQLASAQAALADLEIKAPYEGTVVKVDIASDESVLPNQTVMVIADFSEWYAETDDLTEINVVKIKENQEVRVVADALKDVTMTGRVESIARYYVEKSGDIDYVVRVRMTNVDPRVRWGMTVKITF